MLNVLFTVKKKVILADCKLNRAERGKYTFKQNYITAQQRDQLTENNDNQGEAKEVEKHNEVWPKKTTQTC